MDVKNSAYKQYHENYMANHTGSTIWEPLYLVTPCPLLIYFVSYLVCMCHSSRLSPLSFLIEFVVLIVPVVFAYTVFNAYCHVFFLAVFLLFMISQSYVFQKKSKKFMNIVFTLVLPAQNRPYITYFRSICNILSAFCILAVDFTIFPRRYAKTESYGFGLMDTGVGFFIISNGLVTKPKIKEHFTKSLKSSLPLIALGIIRCISVNSIDYQQHVSEYGIYWNFFFTLAVVKLTCPLILAKWPNGALWTSIALALMHQAALSSGIEDWIINDDSREDLLSANKEGLISLPGYLSLYLAAVFIGKTLSNKSIDLIADIFRAMKLIAIAIGFYILTYILLPEFRVSRRLMSVTYITWLLAFALFTLGLCLLVEVAVRIFHFIKWQSKQDNICPIIIDAVNYNSLVFFLLANMVTGFINLSIKTLHVSEAMGILILFVYMSFICFVISFLYRYRIKLAF